MKLIFEISHLKTDIVLIIREKYNFKDITFWNGTE